MLGSLLWQVHAAVGHIALLQASVNSLNGQKGNNNLTGATRKMFLSIWRNFEKCFLHISLVVRNFWLTISLPFLAVLKLKLTKLAAAAD